MFNSVFWRMCTIKSSLKVPLNMSISLNLVVINQETHHFAWGGYYFKTKNYYIKSKSGDNNEHVIKQTLMKKQTPSKYYN